MKAAPAMPMPVEPSAPPTARMGAAAVPGPHVIDAIVRDVPQALRPAWQELAGRAAEANAFAEPWFVAAGLRKLRAGSDFYLLLAWNGAFLLGLVPHPVAPDYGRVCVTNGQRLGR